METSTKTKASNKSHLPILVFEIELILSQKQESYEEQQKVTKANGNTHQKPKRTAKSNKEHFFTPIFIHSHQFWTYGRWLISRALKSQKNNGRKRKAMKSSKKLRRATKATTDIGAGKTKTGKKKTKTSNERQ